MQRSRPPTTWYSRWIWWHDWPHLRYFKQTQIGVFRGATGAEYDWWRDQTCRRRQGITEEAWYLNSIVHIKWHSNNHNNGKTLSNRTWLMSWGILFIWNMKSCKTSSSSVFTSAVYCIIKAYCVTWIFATHHNILFRYWLVNRLQCYLLFFFLFKVRLGAILRTQLIWCQL